MSLLQQNSDAILKLDKPHEFRGTISGLANGDYIDFTNINFADNPTMSYSSKKDLLTATDTVSGVYRSGACRGSSRVPLRAERRKWGNFDHGCAANERGDGVPRLLRLRRKSRGERADQRPREFGAN